MGKFGTDKRNKNQKNDIPGPNTYFQDTTEFGSFKLGKGRGVKFNKDEKNKEGKNGVPGPGNYEIKGEISLNKEKKKGTSLYFRHQLKTKENVPGPGAYKTLFDSCKQDKGDFMTSQFLKTRNNFIGTEPRFSSKLNNTVGPGNYESQTIFTNRSGGQKNIIWSKDSRFKNKQSDVPGPGQYNLKSKFNEIPPYVKDQIQFDPPTY